MPLVARRLEKPREDELEIAVELAPPSAPMIDVALEAVPGSELPASSLPAAPPAPAPERPSSVPPGKPSPVPSNRPGSIPPGVPRRRAPGEDLIGDLFERMHELSFMADLVSGAEFVLHVLGELIPCEGILVHVFDLGKREFVVVRAQGPNARAALLHRTADDEPLVRGIMSRRGAVVLDGAPTSAPPVSSSLSKLGIKPRAVLCGAARLGGPIRSDRAKPRWRATVSRRRGEHRLRASSSQNVASRPVTDADVVVGQ